MSTEISILKESAVQLPAWMNEDRNLGHEELSKFVVPPRVKIVQKQSGEPFTPRFVTGDAILVPLMMPIARVVLDANNTPTKKGVPFHFVPIFFFTEWATWNDYKMKGTLPAIRERTFDPSHYIAIKSRNPDTRNEPQPENPNNAKISHQEHLNFIIYIVDGECAGQTAVLTFVRGEHKSGSTLCGLINARKPTPVCACVFAANTQYRANAQGDWYGIDVSMPSLQSGIPSSITDKDTYEAFKKLHLQMKEAHAQQLIVVDHDDDDVVNAGPNM